jgi:mycofactocin system glycosyltransferase
LPGAFSLRADSSTTTFDDGTVLLGGSPLRVFRISERARDLIARWQEGLPVGPRRAPGMLARRLVSAGAFDPVPDEAAASFTPRDVTVVVPVRDRPAELDRLLERLGPLACVVVDDASADAASTKDVTARHGAHFVGLETNLGPSGARNAGLAAVESPLVAFVDSDCEPSLGWLEPLLGHFDDPLVGAVAPRIVPAPAADDGPVARYLALRSALDLGSEAAPVRRRSRLTYVPSAALLVRVEVCATSELFDPALRGGEDVDLVWRLNDAGWDVRYVPSSVVGHHGPADLAEHLRRRAFYGSTAGTLALRHPGSLAPVSVSGWSVAVWILAVARRPRAALAVLGVSIGLLARRLRGLVRHPLSVAIRIAGGGTLRSAAPALGELARAWSPALVVALLFRRTRRLAALSLVVPALRDWLPHRDELDPLRYCALHAADDVAYGVGVWAGCVEAGTAEPLIPHVPWRSRVWSSGSLRHDLSPGPRGATGAAPPEHPGSDA